MERTLSRFVLSCLICGAPGVTAAASGDNGITCQEHTTEADVNITQPVVLTTTLALMDMNRCRSLDIGSAPLCPVANRLPVGTLVLKQKCKVGVELETDDHFRLRTLVRMITYRSSDGAVVTGYSYSDPKGSAQSALNPAVPTTELLQGQFEQIARQPASSSQRPR